MSGNLATVQNICLAGKCLELKPDFEFGKMRKYHVHVINLCTVSSLSRAGKIWEFVMERSHKHFMQQ